jgi:hypothetical protein
MPFDPPCFSPDFFFDSEVLNIVRGVMDDRIAADQWGCDVPLRGPNTRAFMLTINVRSPDLALPVYALVVSFGLVV